MGDRAVLVVERYDRVRTASGTIERLHQEDAAQALGLPWGGNDKFEQANGGANLRAIAGLLDAGRTVFDPEPARRPPAPAAARDPRCRRGQLGRAREEHVAAASRVRSIRRSPRSTT